MKHGLSRDFARRELALYAATLFLSAFLLFQVQPLVGKQILPWFGGSAAVWTTCMLFFQVILLGGYGYAHWLVRRFTPGRQALLHGTLLGLALLWLQLSPSGVSRASALHSPAWQILELLSAKVGLPCLMLSSTGPLVQAWFSRIVPSSSPYWLYGLSNLGSLTALAGYPFIIEPILSLKIQEAVWSWCFALFAVLCGLCAVRLWNSRTVQPEVAVVVGGAPPDAPVRKLDPFLWFALSACGVVMLLATTNQICQDIAVVPLLWILPLGIYLLSFVICFSKESLYSRTVYGAMLIGAAAQACYYLFHGLYVSIWWQIVSYSFTLAACCMVCHGELFRLKPPPRLLTRYYLLIAAGGTLGGFLVAFAAPHLFKGYWEFHFGLGATCFVLLVVSIRDPTSFLYQGKPVWAWSGLFLGWFALLVTLRLHVLDTLEDKIEMTRNFYGVLRVLNKEIDNPERHYYSLMHGRIEHGFQFKTDYKRFWPTSYYGPMSGIGTAITRHPRRLEKDQRKLRIGMVGLGAGTTAAYGESGDYVRFYEINPEVVRLSNEYFTFLKDSSAKIEVVVGDARVSMEREIARGESQQFDVLGIDAFSSDAIPVHLLTRESFKTYWSQLKPDGILAIHISSRFVDLKPVVERLTSERQSEGLVCLWISNPDNDTQGVDSSDWILVTKNRQFLDSAEVQALVTPWPQNERPPVLWTDDYSNLLSVLSR